MGKQTDRDRLLFFLGLYFCSMCICIQPAFSRTATWVNAIEKSDLKTLAQGIKQHPKLGEFKVGKASDSKTLFEIALQKENPKVIKLLLQAGGSIQRLQTYGENHIFMLRTAPNNELLNLYLEAGVSPNKVHKTYSKMGDYYTLTPLITTFSYAGNLNAVKTLVKHNVNLDALTFSTYPINNKDTTENKETALMVAIKANQIDIAKFLFEKGANLSLTNAVESSALEFLLATQDRHGQTYTAQALDSRQRLFKTMLKSLAPQQPTKKLLLIMAQQGHLNLLKEMSRQNVALNFSNSKGVTLLMAAASKGQLKTVKWLVSQGLPTHSIDATGASALNYAVRSSDVETFKWLATQIQHNLPNVQGTTLLMEAAAHQNLEIIRELVQKKALLNIPDHQGRTALFYAVQKGNDEDIIKTLQLLLKQGANPHIKDKNKNTLLHAVTQRFVDDGPTFQCRKNTQAAHFVLSLFLDTNTQNTLGKTALMHSVYSADASFVTALLEKGAKPNIQDKNGNTALHHLMKVSCSYESYYANSKLIRKGNSAEQPLLNTLLKYKANPLLKNYFGEALQQKI